ncbi:unnamed protein product [Rotaria magnacalcarata]|uniref:C3H1-type domain-containing protein n=1 Tax=Rotaria magnacalcarata TaxID=392030 RepID=A0A8S2LJS8_9BILA|nr:unnamed protein product [Rotaria magnacalcarata]
MAATFSDTDGRMQSFTDCIHFLNGICNKGDNCRFRHCSTAANQLNKCFKWPASCRDKNCRYRHPSLPKTINNQSSRLFPTSSEPAYVNRRQVSQPEGPASVFWDIEDVYVPNNQKAFDIVQRIRQRVILELNLREFGFTCYCDTASISIETQRSLLHANVRIVHVPSHKPGGVHLQILLDLDRFERAHRPPAVIVLISNAIEFLGYSVPPTIPVDILDCGAAAFPPPTISDVNTNGGLSSAGSTPNWLGVFRADNTCSRTKCCCVGGRVHLTRADDKNIRMQVQYEGNCPPGVSGADQTFAMPSGFSVQQPFSGQIFTIQLSEDSRKITVANRAFPECSGNAIRDSAVSASINMSFVIFLCSLVTVKHFAF